MLNGSTLTDNMFRNWMSQYHRFKHKYNYQIILDQLKDTAILTGQTALAHEIESTLKEIRSNK